MDLKDTNKRICCCSVDKSWLTLCDLMNFTAPNFLVLHYFPEFAQTHVYWVSDATQTSCPLLPPSLTLSLFHHQGLLLWGSSSNQVAKNIGASASAMNIQYWFPLGLTALISLLSKGFSIVFSSTTIRKHQFFGAQLPLWSNTHIHTWLLEKP